MSFINEQSVKAIRKPGQCVGCLKMVEAGQPAVRWAGIVDGDFQTALYHPDCREAEVALNGLHDWRHGDYWIGLWDIDWEYFDWLLAEYPAVAARKGITAELIAENQS